LIIIDLNGKNVLARVYQTPPDLEHLDIDLLSKGTYFIYIKSGNVMLVKQFIKQ
jgi:hypothetical protein